MSFMRLLQCPQIMRKLQQDSMSRSHPASLRCVKVQYQQRAVMREGKDKCRIKSKKVQQVAEADHTEEAWV